MESTLHPLLSRTAELNEKAGMPWAQAEKLALSEHGIDDGALDELIGNCSPAAITSLLNDEEVREFARSILVHQHALGRSDKPAYWVGNVWPVQQRSPAPTASRVSVLMLLDRFYRQAHRMGELFERCQGKGWPDAESMEHGDLRDVRLPRQRELLMEAYSPGPETSAELVAELGTVAGMSRRDEVAATMAAALLGNPAMGSHLHSHGGRAKIAAAAADALLEHLDATMQPIGASPCNHIVPSRG